MISLCLVSSRRHRWRGGMHWTYSRQKVRRGRGRVASVFACSITQHTAYTPQTAHAHRTRTPHTHTAHHTQRGFLALLFSSTLYLRRYELLACPAAHRPRMLHPGQWFCSDATGTRVAASKMDDSCTAWIIEGAQHLLVNHITCHINHYNI